MGKLYDVTDELTVDQLQRLANQKMREAESADEMGRRVAVADAENLRFKARLKGWLSSELRPPE